MNNIKKKHVIKIPNRTTILYDNKKNILVIIGPLTKKSINLKLKINMLKNKNEIEITPISIIKMSNNQKKKSLLYKGLQLL